MGLFEVMGDVPWVPPPHWRLTDPILRDFYKTPKSYSERIPELVQSLVE